MSETAVQYQDGFIKDQMDLLQKHSARLTDKAQYREFSSYINFLKSFCQMHNNDYDLKLINQYLTGVDMKPSPTEGNTLKANSNVFSKESPGYNNCDDGDCDDTKNDNKYKDLIKNKKKIRTVGKIKTKTLHEKVAAYDDVTECKNLEEVLEYFGHNNKEMNTSDVLRVMVRWAESTGSDDMRDKAKESDSPKHLAKDIFEYLADNDLLD